MRKKRWKITALTLVLAIIGSMSISGCRLGKTEVVLTSDFARDEVFRIDETKCMLAEAKVFVTNYQNLYGTVYGVNLWEHDFGGSSLEQYVKDLTISRLAQIISMNLLAKQQEINLTEEETEQVKAASRAYYGSLNKAEIAYMGVKEEDILKLYSQYGLANKLYASLTDGINKEVSDDEARVMDALLIFVRDKENADAVSAGLAKKQDFLNLAAAYNEKGETEISFGRGDMPKAVETAAFVLDKDAVTDAIKTEEGYYFIKCVNNCNQALTDENKQVILERRRKEAFDDVYEAFIETIPSEMNQELWDSVRVEANDEISTSSFFEVYEEYCGW